MTQFKPWTPPTAEPRFWQDTETNLIWSSTSPTKLSWIEAEKWCESLGNGWRMPTIKELFTLINFEKSNPASDCPDTASDVYWSSTTYRSSPSDAWFVGFGYGDVYALNKDFEYRVRAVRGGLEKS